MSRISGPQNDEVVFCRRPSLFDRRFEAGDGQIRRFDFDDVDVALRCGKTKVGVCRPNRVVFSRRNGKELPFFQVLEQKPSPAKKSCY